MKRAFINKCILCRAFSRRKCELNDGAQKASVSHPLDGNSAIDTNGLPCHEGPVIGGEEGAEAGDFLWCSEAACGLAVDEKLHGVFTAAHLLGQLGHFHKFAADKITDTYPTDRYRDETRRLLGVLDARLDGRANIMGDDYTIADIAIFPWVRVLDGFYGAGALVGIGEFGNVTDWVARCEARPASAVGLNMPPRG